MKTVLLTLGRLPKALDVARSFASLGWRVIVADPFKDHLLAASRSVARSVRTPAPAVDPQAYLAALRNIIEAERVDLIVPISEEILHVAHLREVASSDAQVFCMPPATLRAAHDKFAFARHAADMGLGVPHTALASDPAARDIARSEDFVVKQRHSCGGGGVSFHACGDAFAESDQAIVQARARGVELSACALAQDGDVRAVSIYRALTTSGTVAVGFERVDCEPIVDWIAHYVAQTRWTGFISFDFMLGDDGVPLALECNPRLTSGVHFFEMSDIATAVLDLAAPLRFRRERQLQQFWSCLQEAQNALPNLPEFGRRFAQTFRVRDVTWSWTDPMPLVAMPWRARELLRLASREHLPLSVAATRDLAWTTPAPANLETS